MKLKSLLRGSSLDLLDSIAEFWDLRPSQPEKGQSVAALTDHLYPRLQSAPQFKQAFEKLEGGQRELVYFLSLHGGELPLSEFARRTGLHDKDTLAATLEGLNRRGFVWRQRIRDANKRYDLVGVPEPFVRLVELPPYWKGFVGHFLQGLGLAELIAIARHGLGMKYEGRRKPVLVHFVRDRLLDPKLLRGRLDSQPGLERELFGQILHKNGACVWRELLDAGARKRFNHARADVLEQLTKRSGLVFISRPASNHYNSVVMVPRDLRHMIHNEFRSDERTLGELSRGGEHRRRADGPADFRPNVVLDNSHNVLRDLAIALVYVLHRHVKILNNGGVGRNDLKKIVPLMSHNKTVKYVSFLMLFAMAKKLLLPVGERWQVSNSTAQWFSDPRRCFRELYEYWLTTSEWNEEYIEGDVVHVDAYPQNLIGITELRKLVLRVLEKVPVDAWIDFDTFADSLLPQVAIEIPGRFDHAPNEKNNRHTKLIMESIIAEPLYWFGLVTLGVGDMEAVRELGSRASDASLLSASDLPRPVPGDLLASGHYRFSFKLGQAVAAMFEGRFLEPERLDRLSAESDPPASEPSTHITVQPNLEIVAPPDLRLDRLFGLLAFTEVKKVDIMTTLGISRESVRLGMERGLSGPEIIRFMAESSRKELPETVIQLVEECSNRHGEVDLGLAGGYLLAANRAHVEEMRANPRINHYIKDIFSERVIVFSRAVDLEKVNRELQKMGYMPRMASETLHVTAEGLFHVTLRPEELYELLAVLEFSQSLEDDFEEPLFEDKVRSLIERLTYDARGDLNPEYYIRPVVKAFRARYDKLLVKKKDEEKRRLKKQVNRLLTRGPRRREPRRYGGENPTSDPAGIVRLFRYAIEHERQVKIHYKRSTGLEVDEVIEPESVQAGRIYALCPDDDEHHLYAIDRIEQAAL